MLQLFSPIYLSNFSEESKLNQILNFENNLDTFIKDYFININYSSNKNIYKYYSLDTKKELVKLLNYRWEEKKLQKVLNKGVRIEVYFGEDDKLMNSFEAKEFFKNYSTVYYFKSKGHLL